MRGARPVRALRREGHGSRTLATVDGSASAPQSPGATRPGSGLVLLAAVAFFASSPGQSFLISVFVDDLLDDTGLRRETFSALYAAGTVISAVSMLVIGRMVDRTPIRRLWLLAATALAGACLLAGSAVGAATAFFAMAFLRTFGQGAFTLVGTLIATRAARRRRAWAVASASLGLTVASVALPPVVAALILATDWRVTYRVIAVALLVVVLPLGLLVRLPRSEKAPEESGAVETGAVEIADRGVTPLAVGRRMVIVPSRGAARLLVILAAPPLIATALTFHATSILSDQGLTFLQAGTCLSVLGGTSAVGTVAAGAVLDRLSNRGALVLTSAAVTVAPLLLLFHTPIVAYISFAVLGLGMGATSVVNGTIWARTYGLGGLGRLQSTAQSSMITAAAVAPVLPAFARTQALGYAPAFALLGAYGLLALLLALGAPLHEEQLSP
ncbi:MFS transporter [Aeromicrobium sp. CTD01-1L150]|uniref:MFS transporter n=1 Tax=Aeromicrobium sp. CTD01-1L150 TaxID=3341830 RepID=UPI0035C2659F